MQKKSLKFAKIALYNTGNKDFLGYKQILEQEKIPFDIVKSFKKGYDLFIMPYSSYLPPFYITLFDEVKKGLKIITTNTKHSIGLKKHGKGMVFNLSAPFGSYFIDLATLYCKSLPRGVPKELRIVYNKFISIKGHRMIRRKKRILFKRILYNLIGPVKQIWYWPDGHMACFNQRVDVDFPIAKFHKKQALITATNELIEQTDIPCSFFLNYSFEKENNKLYKYFWHDFQSHGCTTTLLHRHYCYDLDNIDRETLASMLCESVVEKGKVFAPPCEQVNAIVLDLCEELGIRFISAGYLGRDDIPYKVVLDREYNIFNIPTIKMEMTPKFNINFFTKEFKDIIKDNSLYCVYLHPELLLTKTNKEKLKRFYKYISKIKKKCKVWVTTQEEIANWWEKRDKITFTKDGVKAGKNIKKRLRVAYWTPKRVVLKRLK